ncbi:MAG: hypothetical protein HKN20_02800 [Gemmatimonadetes bacterium]|nr:hypothetical protein [Gemmatimonadota bacterium]
MVTNRFLAAFFAVFYFASVGNAQSMLGQALSEHEPNRIVWTNDDDDVAYLDLQVSLRYELLPRTFEGISRKVSPEGSTKRLRPYIAFTTRLGQYVKTRESAPVIGKRFNPQIYLRFESPQSWYMQIAYGHESNGQHIDSLDQFQRAQEEELLVNEDSTFARDFVSRGWDYSEFVAAKEFTGGATRFGFYMSGRYFLRDGALEGEPDEFFPWETVDEDRVTRRIQVHGLRATVKYEQDVNLGFIKGWKVAGGFETGVESFGMIGKHQTWRVESTVLCGVLPIHAFASTGFGGDLARYNRKVDSFGFGFEFRPSWRG